MMAPGFWCVKESAEQIVQSVAPCTVTVTKISTGPQTCIKYIRKTHGCYKTIKESFYFRNRSFSNALIAGARKRQHFIKALLLLYKKSYEYTNVQY